MEFIYLNFIFEPLLLNFHTRNILEAGCDEAGRGCLAGPVFAAAVILPHDYIHPLLNDSKQVTVEDREELRVHIEENALSWAVAKVKPHVIDRINILRASFRAMHHALGRLQITPDHILVDGNRFTPFKKIPFTTVVKGDGKYTSIAAASILAKTHRDAYMRRLHQKFPQYGWEENKGYPTKSHRDGIEQFGSTEHHRKSFRLLPDMQLELFEN